MITLIEVTIEPSGHFSFPLVAEGTLHLPHACPLPIIEMGRSRAEVIERVFAFAQFHASHHIH